MRKKVEIGILVSECREKEKRTDCLHIRDENKEMRRRGGPIYAPYPQINKEEDGGLERSRCRKK